MGKIYSYKKSTTKNLSFYPLTKKKINYTNKTYYTHMPHMNILSFAFLLLLANEALSVTVIDSSVDCSEICPPVEIVFIFDTSGSMQDESNTLCPDVATWISEISSEVTVVNFTTIGISNY